MPITGARFVTTCVNSTYEDISPMIENAQEITRRAFLRSVDRLQLIQIETKLGYEQHYRQGLTMARDYAVSYRRSVYRGRPCVFFRWSAIEYVFQVQEKK